MENKNKLRTAIIGAGRISDEHLDYLTQSDFCDVIALCDRSQAIAEVAQRRFDIPEIYLSSEDMLAQVKPDVVHICTPAASHEPLIAECIAAGAHMIVEKPITLSRDAFQRLHGEASTAGLQLVENHNYRWNSPIQALTQAVEDGLYGDIREVEVRVDLSVCNPGGGYSDENLPHPSHKLPGDVIHEYLTHMSYLLLQYMPQVDSCNALWRKFSDSKVFRFDDLDAQLDGSHDDKRMTGRLRFSAHTGPDGFTVTVRGEKGNGHADIFQPHVKHQIPRKGPDALGGISNQLGGGWSQFTAGMKNFAGKALLGQSAYDGLNKYLHATYQALASGSPPPVTFEHIDNALALIELMLADQPAQTPGQKSIQRSQS